MMVGISVFGAMFTWMMIFVTHYFFRRARLKDGSAPAPFRMWGFPVTTLLGAALMAALLVTTAFTEAFRMTLVFGLPYLAALALHLLAALSRPHRASFAMKLPASRADCEAVGRARSACASGARFRHRARTSSTSTATRSVH